MGVITLVIYLNLGWASVGKGRPRCYPVPHTYHLLCYFFSQSNKPLINIHPLSFFPSPLTHSLTPSTLTKLTFSSLLSTMSSSTSTASNTTTFYFNTTHKCKLSKKEASSRSTSSTTSPLINNSSTQRKCAFARKCARLVKEQRARFYIMRRCVIMLICWHEYSDS